MRRSSKLAVFLFALLVLFGGWLAYYAQDKGFTAYWRQRVEAEFEQRGVYATMRRLNLDPLRGLIAKDVLVYEDPERQILLMKVDDVALNVNFAALAGGRLTLNAFEVRNAKITLPLENHRKLKGERLVLDDLSARVLVPPGEIEIVRAVATIQGLEVRLSGQLQRNLPGENDPSKPSGEPDETSAAGSQLANLRSRHKIIQKFLSFLEKTDFGEPGRAVLEVHVQGDTAKPETLQARGTLRAGSLGFSHFRGENLTGQWNLDQGTLRVRDLEVRDAYGKLRTEFEYAFSDRQLRFSLDSTVDLPGLLRDLTRSPVFNEVVFYMPPQIVASGTFDFSRPFDWQNLPLDVVGELEADRTTSRGVIFEALSADFSARGPRLFLRNVVVEHKTGILNCDLIRDSNGVEYRADLRIHPTIFAPFLKLEGSRDFLNRWSFHDNSAVFVQVAGFGPGMQPTEWTTRGMIDLRDCQLNGHPISQLQAEIEFEKEHHRFRNVVITRPEGAVSGERITLDHGSNLFRLEGVSGRVFPTHAVGWFAPEAASYLLAYQFENPPELSFEGTIDARPPSVLKGEHPNHDYTIGFASDGPARYELFGKTLRLQAPKGLVSIEGDTVRLTDFSSDLLGGQIQSEASLTRIHDDLNYQVEIRASDLDFRGLAELYSTYKDTGGRLSGFARFNGRPGEVSSLRGTGTATVLEGNVFSFPAFGPLSKPVSEALPRLHSGLSVAKEAQVGFEIRDGSFIMDSFRARTSAFQMKGSGTVDLRTHEIDMLSTLNVRGPASTVLAPVSKLLEFRGQGHIEMPVWRPRNVPDLPGEPLRDLVEGAGEGLRRAQSKLPNLKPADAREEDSP